MKVNYGVSRKIKKGDRRGCIETRNYQVEMKAGYDNQDMMDHIKANHKGWSPVGWAVAKEDSNEF